MKRIKLGSSEKVISIDEIEIMDQKMVLIQHKNHGPSCNWGCLAEGGCSWLFSEKDIEGGNIQELQTHPENFVIVRNYKGDPVKIKKMMKLDENEIRNVGKRFRKALHKLVELSDKYGGYSKIPDDCEEVKEYFQAFDEYDRVKKMIDNIRELDPYAAEKEALRLYNILDGFDT